MKRTVVGCDSFMGYDFCSMNYRPFNGVPCAYHLHYYFCFQTKFSRPRFGFAEADERLAAALQSFAITAGTIC
jgi:hypothetical protein